MTCAVELRVGRLIIQVIFVYLHICLLCKKYKKEKNWHTFTKVFFQLFLHAYQTQSGKHNDFDKSRFCIKISGFMFSIYSESLTAQIKKYKQI